MLGKFLKISAVALGSLIGLVILCIVGLTLYLTPERLSKLVEKYAREFVDARISTSSIDYSLWSSFPYFNLTVKDALIVSEKLDSLSASQRALLPVDADTLARFSEFHGSINPLMLIFNKIDIRRVTLSGLDLNLVALNDSLNNYDIIRPTEQKKTPFTVPRFTVKELSLINLKPIRYYSAATRAEAQLCLSRANVERNPRDHNCYRMVLAGTFNFDVEKEHILKNFPFNFDGNLIFGFNPFKVKLDKYQVQFANLKSRVNLSLDIGDESRLTEFDYTVSPFSLLELLGYLPSSWIGDLGSLHSNLMLEASLRTTAPYKFSNDTLPSFAVDFRVPDSWLVYSPRGGESYRLNNISLAGSLLFNGRDINKSQLLLNNLNLNGEGIALYMKAKATNLFTSPFIETSVDGDADFEKVALLLPQMKSTRIAGKMNCGITAAFKVDDLIAQRLSRINVKGNASIKGLRVHDTKEDYEISNHVAKFTFGSDVVKVGKMKVADGMLAFTALLDTASIRTPDVQASAKGIGFMGGMTRSVLTEKKIPKEEVLPFGFKTEVENVRILSISDSMNIRARQLNLTASLTRYEGESRSPLLNAIFTAGRLRFRDAMTFGNVKDARATLNLHLNKGKGTGTKNTRYQLRYDSIAKANPTLGADSIAVLARALRKVSERKDNETVNVKLDGSLKNLIRRWNVSGTLGSKEGMIANYLYPVRTFIRNLDMAFSLDSVYLKNLDIRSQSNALNIKGSISNLRRFMLGYKRTPVRVRLDVCADTISLNEIAGTYEAGQKIRQQLIASGALPAPDENNIESVASKAQQTTDTTMGPMLLPHNIDAEINVNAKEAEYTNLHIFDLGTRVLMKDAALNIDSLHARTDFGTAYLNLLYSSRNADDLMMSFDTGFDRIDVVIFFQRFQALLAMMPDMSNLSGFVSAKMAGSLNFFPNMDINFPSMRAVIDVRGTELKVHQNEFIRHIARMMLIRQEDDLKIKNMVIQASVHDNLFELYPFIFEIPKYRIGFMGENDFNGNMYYHVSVLKSPIPFKFGINIKGNFDKYKIRFGGAKYKSDEAAKIVKLIDDRRVNLVKEMKGFIQKLVHKAALSDVGSPHLNMLNNGPLSEYREHQDSIERQSQETVSEEMKLFPMAPIRVLLQHENDFKKAAEKKINGK